VLTLDPLELRRRLTIRRDDEAGYIKEDHGFLVRAPHKPPSAASYAGGRRTR